MVKAKVSLSYRHESYLKSCGLFRRDVLMLSDCDWTDEKLEGLMLNEGP